MNALCEFEARLRIAEAEFRRTPFGVYFFLVANMIGDSNEKGTSVCMQGRLFSALVTFHTNVHVCGDGLQQPA